VITEDGDKSGEPNGCPYGGTGLNSTQGNFIPTPAFRDYDLPIVVQPQYRIFMLYSRNSGPGWETMSIVLEVLGGDT